METVIVAFFVMLALDGAMAVGVIFGRAPIKGSCGGLGAVGIDQGCEICGGDPQRCESIMEPAPVRQYDPYQDGR